MKKLIILISIGFVILFSGCTKEPLDINKIEKVQPKDSIYLKGSSKKALVLAHGQGKHPNFKVVNPLRVSMNKEQNFHTLSLQMPNKRNNWNDYSLDFPEAHKIIMQGISFLKSQGVEEVYLMGHSMGSRMMSSFASEYEIENVKGLIIVGCRNNGGYPLSCINNVNKIKNVPILDIWGDSNSKDADSAKERKRLASKQYKQVPIIGGNHRLDGYDEELKDTIVKWLESN